MTTSKTSASAGGNTMRRLLATLMLAMLACVPAQASEVTGKFKLVAQDGSTVTEASYDGKIRMVTFGYTFCPDICPTTLSTMAATMDLLGAKAAQVVPIFVTVDPHRDTREHLRDYVEAFGPSFVGLTGSQEAVDAAAKAFRVRYVLNPPADPADPDTYFVDHSAGIYIMDRQGRFVAKLGHRSDPDEVAARLLEVMDK